MSHQLKLALSTLTVPPPRPPVQPGDTWTIGSPENLEALLAAGRVRVRQWPRGSVNAPDWWPHRSCLHCMYVVLSQAGHDLSSVAGRWLLGVNGKSRWIAHHPAGCPTAWSDDRHGSAPRWAITAAGTVLEPPDRGGEYGHKVTWCAGKRCTAVTEHARIVHLTGDLETLLNHAGNCRGDTLMALREAAPLLRSRRVFSPTDSRLAAAQGSLAQAAAWMGYAAGANSDGNWGALPRTWGKRPQLLQDVSLSCLHQMWFELTAAAAVVEQAAGAARPHGERAPAPTEARPRPRTIALQGLAGFARNGNARPSRAWPALNADLTFLDDPTGPVLLTVRPTHDQPPVGPWLSQLLDGALLKRHPDRLPDRALADSWVTLLTNLPGDAAGVDPAIAEDIFTPLP